MGPPSPNDRCLFWLGEWARWMRDDKGTIARMVGFRTHSAGFVSGGLSSVDTWGHMCDDVDVENVRIINRAVNALDAPHYGAICNRFFCQVWTYRGDPEQMFVEAVGQVWRMATKLGVMG